MRSTTFAFFLLLGFAFFGFGLWHLAGDPSPANFAAWNRAAWGFLSVWLPVQLFLLWDANRALKAALADREARRNQRPSRLLK